MVPRRRPSRAGRRRSSSPWRPPRREISLSLLGAQDWLAPGVLAVQLNWGGQDWGGQAIAESAVTVTAIAESVDLGVSAPLLLGSLLGGSVSLALLGARDGESPLVLAVQFDGSESGKAVSAVVTTIGQTVSVDLSVSTPLLLSGVLLSGAEGGQTPWVLALELNGSHKSVAAVAESVAKSVELSISAPLLLSFLSWG